MYNFAYAVAYFSQQQGPHTWIPLCLEAYIQIS
jgi:hypothetical protein